MKYIVLHNNYILNISDIIESLYFNLLAYIKILIDCNYSKINYINSILILEINNNIPTNNFTIDINTFNLIDNSKNIIVINNTELNNIRINLLNTVQKNNQLESEINVFLPIHNSSDNINNSIYIKSNTVNDNKKNDIIKLTEKIDEERQRLEEKNNNYEKLLNNYLENKHKIGLIEKKLKLKIEKEEEKKRIFDSDLQIYNCLISEINDNSREMDDIPELFKNKFKIFIELHKKYDNYNILEDQYDKFMDMTKELKLVNHHIATNYDDLFDRDKNNDSDSDIDIFDSE
jgi:hypothetical protein